MNIQIFLQDALFSKECSLNVLFNRYVHVKTISNKTKFIFVKMGVYITELYFTFFVFVRYFKSTIM